MDEEYDVIVLGTGLKVRYNLHVQKCEVIHVHSTCTLLNAVPFSCPRSDDYFLMAFMSL